MKITHTIVSPGGPSVLSLRGQLLDRFLIAGSNQLISVRQRLLK